MNAEKKSRRLKWEEERGRVREWSTVGNGSCSLATPCAEGRVIAGCWFVKWSDRLLRASQPASQKIVAGCRDIL